jgi:hypothetical protein
MSGPKPTCAHRCLAHSHQRSRGHATSVVRSSTAPGHMQDGSAHAPKGYARGLPKQRSLTATSTPPVFRAAGGAPHVADALSRSTDGLAPRQKYATGDEPHDPHAAVDHGSSETFARCVLAEAPRASQPHAARRWHGEEGGAAVHRTSSEIPCLMWSATARASRCKASDVVVVGCSTLVFPR